jgi:hypothetical protein
MQFGSTPSASRGPNARSGRGRRVQRYRAVLTSTALSRAPVPALEAFPRKHWARSVEHRESRRGRPSRTETSCRYRREPCARIGGRYLRRLPSMKHYVKRFSEPAGALVGASVGARFHPTLARCQGLDSHFLQARCTIKRPRVSLDHSVR